MSVTIYNVASLAHVSVTTISKILNHKDSDISDETRERVINVINELKFTPSGLARSLVTKKTNVLGLLLPDISNPYFADMARGVEDGANSFGYNVIFCNTDENHNKELEYLHILQGRCADGIVIVSTAQSGKIFASQFDFEKPFVLLERVYENMSSDICKVRFNNVKGGYLATKYLVDRGHKRIGIINGKNCKPANDRLKGYKMALEHAGIEVDEAIIYEGNYKYESGLAGARYLLNNGVTAIFTGNDIMASGAYKAILEKGLKIPEDISVIGYDNAAVSKTLDPPLTTVLQPIIEMGRVAATMLIRQIKKEETEKETVFEPRIIERQSVCTI